MGNYDKNGWPRGSGSDLEGFTPEEKDFPQSRPDSEGDRSVHKSSGQPHVSKLEQKSSGTGFEDLHTNDTPSTFATGLHHPQVDTSFSDTHIQAVTSMNEAAADSYMEDGTEATEPGQPHEGHGRTGRERKPLSINDESDVEFHEQETRNTFDTSTAKKYGSGREARIAWKASHLNKFSIGDQTYRPLQSGAVNDLSSTENAFSEDTSAESEQYSDISTESEYPSGTSTEREQSNNVHILGPGHIGRFIAHSLAGMVQPPQVTLLLHSRRLIGSWYDEGEAITLYSGKLSETRSNLRVESAIDFPFNANTDYPSYGTGERQTSIVPPTSVIEHLIVTVKINKLVEAVSAVKSRLRPTSTICFIHNGMGAMEKINELVFPDPDTRPQYIFGTISHGVGTVADLNFSCTLYGSGALNLCKIDSAHDDFLAPRDTFEGYGPTSRFLLRTLTRCDPLFAQGFLYNEFLLLQLEKLAINAVINPLSVVYDCRNGDLLRSTHINDAMEALVREVTRIIVALPELNDRRLYTLEQRRGLEKRFTSRKLYFSVNEVCRRTAGNLSSTLQDVRKGIDTEIQSINGWLRRRGDELGMDTKLNALMVHVVLGKMKLVRYERNHQIPFWRPVKM